MAKSKSAPPHFLELLKNATAIVLDVDGVLTDGSLLITNNGDELRTMNIRDGYALQLAVKKGLMVAVISGGKSNGVIYRLNRLGIQYVLMGVEDKPGALRQLASALKMDLATTVYMGDDIPDVEVMQLCGFPCCPANAAAEVKAIAKYTSPFEGGNGCVRDVIEKILKLQAKWL